MTDEYIETPLFSFVMSYRGEQSQTAERLLLAAFRGLSPRERKWIMTTAGAAEQRSIKTARSAAERRQLFQIVNKKRTSSTANTERSCKPSLTR